MKNIMKLLHLHFHNSYNTRQAMYCTYNVTLRRVRATSVVLEQQ